MGLGVDEATRVLRFCLAGDGWGTAVDESGACVLKVMVNRVDAVVTYRFEAGSYEETLMQGVAAGILKASSVERQIAFISREAGAAPVAPKPPVLVDAAVFAALTAGVSALVHEAQRERGISSLYAASGGRVFASELGEQWHRTDGKWRDLLHLRRKHGDSLPADIRAQLDGAQAGLANVVASRRGVRALDTLPPQLIEVYSSLNAEMLHVIDDLSMRVANPLQRPTALAWMSLLHAKEKTGIERAQLASAFARDRFLAGQHLAVAALIAGRHCYLHLFAAAAPGHAGRHLRDKLSPDVIDQVERMEKIALSRANGRFGVDAAEWFAAVSRLVERLAHVEAVLRNDLARA